MSDALPPGIEQIMDLVGEMARGYGHLKWNERAMLKSDMVRVRRRWRPVSSSALRAKCDQMGMRQSDIDEILDMLAKSQAGRRMVPNSAYRGFEYSIPVDPQPVKPSWSSRQW